MTIDVDSLLIMEWMITKEKMHDFYVSHDNIKQGTGRKTNGDNENYHLLKYETAYRYYINRLEILININFSSDVRILDTNFVTYFSLRPVRI